MRLAKISTAYPAYLERFYLKHDGLAEKTSMEQQAALDYDAFGFADFWKSALEPLGYRVTEILANAMTLQKAWAAENGVEIPSDASESTLLLDLAAVRIRRLKPEVLFLTNYAIFSKEWIRELRERCPSIRLVLGWCGAPFNDASVFEAYDLVLTCIPELKERFVGMGHRSEHIDHAFDPRILDRISTETEPHMDFTFIGQVVRDRRFHTEREELLSYLLKRTGIQIFSPSSGGQLDEILRAVRRGMIYDLRQSLKGMGVPETVLDRMPMVRRARVWKERPLLPINRRLGKAMRPPLFGLEMFQALHDSRVTLNSHINISPRSASNMRLFEATGVGACLLTDWKENIGDLFAPDLEVVTYRSEEECVEKVRWLIDHPAQREEIGRAGQKRTLKDHTFDNRVQLLDKMIRSSL
jgi:hypothetical protein